METDHDKWQISMHDLLQEQAKDTYCCKVSPVMGLKGYKFEYDRNGLLISTAPIAGTVQKVFSISLQTRLLYKFHYPALVQYSRRRCIYGSTRRKHYWPPIVNDVHRFWKSFGKYTHSKTKQKPMKPTTIVSSELWGGICLHGHPGTTSEDDK